MSIQVRGALKKALIQHLRSQPCPQTLGYGLFDSPIGQAMWIYEKFQAWSDNMGDPAGAIPADRTLDDITLYWLTDTAASSARLYYESFAKDFARMPLDLPVAASVFKGDFFTQPKVRGDQTYSKLFYWNEVPKGGHFAALSNLSYSLQNCVKVSLRCVDVRSLWLVKIVALTDTLQLRHRSLPPAVSTPANLNGSAVEATYHRGIFQRV
jgi:hypothetical protein